MRYLCGVQQIQPGSLCLRIRSKHELSTKQLFAASRPRKPGSVSCCLFLLLLIPVEMASQGGPFIAYGRVFKEENRNALVLKGCI